MTNKTMVRLVADEGKLITNGTTSGTVVDVPEENVGLWYEIDKPAEETTESTTEETTTEEAETTE